MVSPYLHDRGKVLYNPATGVSIPKDGEEYRALSRIEKGLPVEAGAAALEHLRAARFLIEDLDSETRRSHLLFLSLETCTRCNHRCPFCPVSVDPREREVMSQELFESIVDQVVAVGGKASSSSSRTTTSRRSIRSSRSGAAALFARGLPVSILTNASHFDPGAGRRARGGGPLPLHRHQPADARPGALPEAPRHAGPRARARQHRRDARPASSRRRRRSSSSETRTRRTGATSRRSGARFEPRGWEVKPFRIRSRPASGTFVPEPPPKKKLRGCELMGSRPFEHLHVTATAKAVLCCQDYYEQPDRRRPEDADRRGGPGRRRDGAAAPLDVRRRGGPRGFPLPPLRVRARGVRN